jgi:hypothetical protein
MRNSSSRQRLPLQKSCPTQRGVHHRVTLTRTTIFGVEQAAEFEPVEGLSSQVVEPARREAVLGWLAEVIRKAIHSDGGKDDRTGEDTARAS